MKGKEVYVVGGVRTPFVKSFTKYSKISTQKLMEASLNELVSRFKLNGKTIGDVALGAVISSSKNWNLARECVLSSNLSKNTPAYNVQRACGTSFEAVYQIFAKMTLGHMDTGIAGGVDTNSDAPIEVNKILRNLIFNLKNSKTLPDKLKTLLGVNYFGLGVTAPTVVEPRTGLSMGQHCELMVKEWEITQKEQDEVALLSHQKASKAYNDGFYQDLLVSIENVHRDGFVREDTTLEKLQNLKPVFDKEHGTLTAGNSSPLSDGSSVVLLATREGAQELGLTPQARWVDFQSSAVDFVGGEGLLMAPTLAVAKILSRNHLKLQDFDYYEIHEAFAGQVLCTLRAWENAEYCKNKLHLNQVLGSIDTNKMNVVGGSVALGHPFAATGGRIVGSLSKLLAGTRKKALISICTAGGMGMAGIIEGV
ncbi:MAG: acetyl-CoA C-acetyltransferase [Bdellovibrionales bacterium]|nr:acetyl-CoA C-acetyltransferase [Bdellovibrionales bacterium]